MDDNIIDIAISEMNLHSFSKIPFNKIIDDLKVSKREVINAVDLSEIKGLLEFSGNNHIAAKLTLFGSEIVKNGGWLKYIESEKVKKEKTESKESLDNELKILQKESLEYQKTIREQSDRIRNLDEQIKIINLLKEYWWFIGACIIFGGLLKEFLERTGLIT
jgi:flagellar motility protein MotE (MotC chaperone)